MRPNHDEHELLRLLVEGTAAASGEQFFQSLVKHLATALGVRFAFVAEFAEAPTKVRTLAFWAGDKLRDNIEYVLAGTPCEEVVRGGICHHPDNVTDTYPHDSSLIELNAASYLGVPLRDADGNVLGHLAVMDVRPMPEEPRNIAVFHIFATRVRTEMLRLQAEKKLAQANQQLEAQVAQRTKELSQALREVEELKDRLHAENLYLQDEIKGEHHFEDIIGGSTTLKTVLGQVEQVAATPATVLILGESGTGKELLARAIHDLSDRRTRPLVKVNCAALPAELIESELFGHEKGSFTGAAAQRIGRFELAHGGTIFLDEIGDLPLELQVKLLRVLQEREFERLGGSTTIKIDTRVIAATNRDLKKRRLKVNSARTFSTGSTFSQLSCRRFANVRTTFRFSPPLLPNASPNGSAKRLTPYPLKFSPRFNPTIGQVTSANCKTSLSGPLFWRGETYSASMNRSGRQRRNPIPPGKARQRWKMSNGAILSTCSNTRTGK